MSFSTETWILILRLALAIAIYAFLYQVAVAIYRSLRADEELARARATAHAPAGPGSAPAEVPILTHGTLLVVESAPGGPVPGTTFPIQGSILIGRAGRSTLILDDGFVSGEHARIERRAGHLVLEDLGSTNGTLLNGRPVTEPAPLHPGDVIQIGGTRLILRAPSDLA